MMRDFESCMYKVLSLAGSVQTAFLVARYADVGHFILSLEFRKKSIALTSCMKVLGLVT